MLPGSFIIQKRQLAIKQALLEKHNILFQLLIELLL